MTDKQYVMRAAKMMKIDVIAPTKGNPGIVGTDWAGGFGKHVIDAQNWKTAREQINAYNAKRAT